METVILKSFDNYFSANIILSKLRTEGIEGFLVDEFTSTINPILGNAIGGIKLAVDIRDSERATELLKLFHEEYMKSAVCPHCGQTQLVQIPSRDSGNFLTSILTWLFSSYAVSAEYVYHCTNCGYENENLPPDPVPYN